MSLAFLQANGVETSKIENTVLYDAMIAIAEKRGDKAGLAEIFRRHLSAQFVSAGLEIGLSEHRAAR